MSEIPTIQVFIEGHDGAITINEEDFDPEVHTKTEEAEEPKKKSSKKGK